MDKKTKAMGFPVGSATLIDEVGIDVGAHIADYISGVFGPRFGIGSNENSMLKDMVAQGYLGMIYAVFRMATHLENLEKSWKWWFACCVLPQLR